MILEGAEAQAGDRLPQTAWPDVEGSGHTHLLSKLMIFYQRHLTNYVFGAFDNFYQGIIKRSVTLTEYTLELNVYTAVFGLICVNKRTQLSVQAIFLKYKNVLLSII